MLLVFALFWSTMTLLFDGFMFVPMARQVIALNYADTQGTIVSSRVVTGSGEDGTVYGVKIEYTYSVDGKTYNGTRYRFGDHWKSSDNQWAYQAVAQFPAGATVPVYYSTWHHQEAVLVTGLQGADLYLLAFMTPFNAVMLFLARAGWQRWLRRWFKLPAGGVPIITESRRIRVRLTEWSPVGAAIATTALLAFLSTFAVGISGGFHPSLPLMGITWIVILGGGILAGGWHGLQLRRGKYDLVIDEPAGVLELPALGGRKTRRRVPFPHIEDLLVQTVRINHAGEEARANYTPSVVIGGDTPATEKLAVWRDEKKAYEFVQWLRERVPCNHAPARPLAGRF